ncbi:threonine/serine dehydratase [Virgibacillus halodenitrificans]|uniref:threonine ammonia-lyase n=1 Tax=Virgibacillus halodenitrificans TaxID=1482 RepID=UPI0024BF3254|nr:threonine/serine dehydratase [Virgibacillus halodenitrificans]WHX26655.1 threonine/serine dehydratase [Virgibacillus halodenitrificans]
MITVQKIFEARDQIKDIVKETPIFQSTLLSDLAGNKLFFKAEHLQRTGSFKIRGATNKVMQVAKNGATFVTAASSGNHGQAVAYISNKVGIKATIVVPEDAISSKIKAIQAYHGSIETCGTTSAERLPRAKQLANENEGVFIPPYDDPYIIAGQGTIGLEILEQLDSVDVIVVPIGGGGLISGILSAIKEVKPSIQIIGVEPETANDTLLSLKKGEIVAIQQTKTIADGLRTSQPGSFTFPIVQKYIDDIVTVSEQEIQDALFLMLERTKQIIEPSSATTVAAVLNDKLNVRDKNIVCVLSGGNVDVRTLSSIFNR